jgi:hypothetical protein
MKGCRGEHKVADPPNAIRLLSPRPQRPESRAAEQSDELPPLHSITSSALASILSGTVMPSAFFVLFT